MDGRMDSASPPPRFSESMTSGSWGSSSSPGPRFTEHFNASPPYQQFGGFDPENAPIPRYEQPDGPPHRLSSKDRSLSPSELVSPFPEYYRKDEDEKEVAMPPTLLDTPRERHEEMPRKKRICGLPLMWVLIVLGIILVLAITLGVGLSVGLSRGKGRSHSTPAGSVNTMYLIGGAIDPAYYSTTGAFNGSGIALAQQSFSANLTQGSQGSIVMYFQHYDGGIRYMQLSSQGEWLGGDISTTVAKDAKNGTALSAVSYVTSDYSLQYHVFYIDQNNNLKQRSNSNTSNLWTDGLINNLNLTVLDADIVGMQACYYGNDYGDSDYKHTPLPNGQVNASANAEVGMHMWFASDETTFQQYGWRLGQESWEYQNNFTNMNGHAGVGCYSWGPGTVTYVMFVNTEDSVEFWWKDTNTNLTSTPAHPINQWVNSSIAINNVYPATSLGYTNAFYAQDAATLNFYGHNISWAAENTSFVESSANFEVNGDSGLPGTHVSVSALPNASGGDNLVVFYQTVGNDISEYTRDLIAGVWSSVDVEIPAD